MTAGQYRWYLQKIIEWNGLVADTATLNAVIKLLEEKNNTLASQNQDLKMVGFYQEEKLQIYSQKVVSLNLQLARSESWKRRWKQGTIFFVATTFFFGGVLVFR